MRHLALLQILAVLLMGTISQTASKEIMLAQAAPKEAGGGTISGDVMLPPVVLKEADGGTAAGEAWKSIDLKGKTQLILYVDPGKKKKAAPLIEKIDSLNYSTDRLGINFIVNTRATSVPDVLIRLMIKRRAEANKNIQYILDRNEILIKNWGFTDENLNILVLDTSGNVLHRYAGEITEEYIDRLINEIDNALEPYKNLDNP